MYIEHLFRRSDNADTRIFAKEPEFYVFYNGKEPYTGKELLKLSDSFSQKHDEYALELSVKVVNINYDKGNYILQQCKILEEYSLFVEAVRRNSAVDKEHGFEKAIKECIQNNILKEYLRRKSKEVLNMLIGEYDYATDIAVQREESFDMGLERGKAEGSRQAKLETARILRQLGDSTQKIVHATGLSQAEVEALH